MNAAGNARRQDCAGAQGSETTTVTSPLIAAINSVPGCFAIRVNSGRVRVRGGWMHGAPEGTPDLFAVVHGSTCFLEAKTAAGKLSDVQRKRHEELRRCGCRVEVVRSVAEGMTVVRQMVEARR